ncbi:nucleoid occlusion protein [Ligilactobacillus ceti]|uniref:Chromosome partitioning protein, DNA-binding protein n=1 Tax=Ligilactobacillus ceti DSM 22408 TaxID=1122146 RepID=A0A0R2KRI4_9LACO|nr:nucleoid occlusion protein [Ligilactobacillus ceti]KRN89548.1 chromosome partitioning protein, DNA-binding protein [Ligilactobacillus ceti DSM 22408]
MAWSFFKGNKNEEVTTNEQSKVQELPLSQIIPNQYQPRRVFSDESIKELADTIDKHGLLQPIIVRRAQGETTQYEIIAGERRFRAITSLKWENIPAIIKEMDDTQAASLAVIENLQREGLTAIEEAQAYQNLMDLNQMTQVELGRAIGKSQSFVANKMRLLKLAPAVQRVMLKRKISERHGRCLVGLPDAQQVEIMKEIIAKNLSVKETEAVVKEIKNTKKKPTKKTPKKKKVVQGKAKDTRLAVNTIKKSLKLITDNGFEVKTTEEKHPEFHRIIIDIPIEKPAEKKTPAKKVTKKKAAPKKATAKKTVKKSDQ